MKYRGWKYRSYADEPETPVADFICGVLGGTVGFFNFPGWLLIYFGWLDATHTLLLCIAAGFVFGGYLLCKNLQERKRA